MSNEYAGLPEGYLAALMIGEKAAQGFEIVIEEINSQDGQVVVLKQRIEAAQIYCRDK